jgi:AcrR family transcriptional regulator
MYKYCTTEESALRQRQFEQCLLELMQTIPYPQISIVQICAQAGLSRKSFYRYFGSKDDCLLALIDHAIMDGSSYYLPEFSEQAYSRSACERFFSYWKSMHPLLKVLAENDLITPLAHRMSFYLEREEWGLKHTRRSRERIIFLAGGIMSLVMHWHHTGYEKSTQEMASILESILSD